jgi:hypothetical protein
MTLFPFPFPLSASALGSLSVLLYLLIGFAFGYVLEISGFGNSIKLAGQFYFKELTVLKVMFTAIIVAMVLIFLTAGLGLLDFNLVWVNPTYLWPGIVGGLIMGVGFIVGGFCPGTSLVGASTFKIDAIIFLLGVYFGIFAFNESLSIPAMTAFWESSNLGRLTLMDVFNASTGLIVLLVVLMALFMFWGSEQLEHIVGKMDTSKEPKWRIFAAGAIVLVAVGTIFIGQPTTQARWAVLAPAKQTLLDERKVQIHPGELLSLMHDDRVNLVMLDVRGEADFNRFHILDAQNVAPDGALALIGTLQYQPANTVFVLMSNDETVATGVWKMLVAESIPNVYILEGGVNNWLAIFTDPQFQKDRAIASHKDEALGYTFEAALGANYAASSPNPDILETLTFEKKVILEGAKGGSGGGCG